MARKRNIPNIKSNILLESTSSVGERKAVGTRQALTSNKIANGNKVATSSGRNVRPPHTPRGARLLPANPQPESVNIIEQIQVSSSGGRVDIESGIIYQVKLCGLESKNGCRYSQNALKRDAHLYEGVRIYKAHPESRPAKGYGRIVEDTERKPDEIIAVVTNPRVIFR